VLHTVSNPVIETVINAVVNTVINHLIRAWTPKILKSAPYSEFLVHVLGH
jgi:hypothetical protein